MIALALVACGPSVDCTDPTRVASEQGGAVLTCEAASSVGEYVEALAGRPLAPGDAGLVLHAVVGRFRHDPASTVPWVGAIVTALADLRGRTGLDLAEARSGRAWAAKADVVLSMPPNCLSKSAMDWFTDAYSGARLA